MSEEEDNVNDILYDNNVKSIADIEEIPTTIETETIAKPFNEILKTIEEQSEETVKEESTENIEEDKPKKTTKRDKDKERVNCPDCGKELSYHVLKYDHKKFCKAVKKQEE